MTRRLLSLLLLTGLLLGLAGPAGAQTPDQVAARVRDYGYWIDAGLPADEARISAAVSRAGNAGIRLFVVLLENDPPGGPTTFADAVLDRLADGTVLVKAETGAGMASWDLDPGVVDRALDAGYATSGGDVEFVDGVVASLIGAPVGPGDGDGDGQSGSGGSKTGLIVMLVLVGGLVLLVVWAVRRQSKGAAQSKARAVEEARKEIKAQLDAMANTILEITDKVSLSASREDNQYLEQAGRTFNEAAEGYETAADPARLEEISGRLDEARWQLDAAGALADGKPVPPRPTPEERHACFFDPTHGGPFEEAEVRTAAGTRTVRVCAADAAKLRRGEQPEPRMIEVGGRRIPAPGRPEVLRRRGLPLAGGVRRDRGRHGPVPLLRLGFAADLGRVGVGFGLGVGLQPHPLGIGRLHSARSTRVRAGRTGIRRRR